MLDRNYATKPDETKNQLTSSGLRRNVTSVRKRGKKILAEDGGGKKQATYAAVAPQHPTRAICRCNQLREEENKAEKHTAYIVFWFFTNTLRTVMGDEPL